MIAVVLLVAVGPQRLPALMKAVGQGMREFRRATAELRRASGIDEIMRDDPLGTRRRPAPARRLPPPTPPTRPTSGSPMGAAATGATGPKATDQAGDGPPGSGQPPGATTATATSSGASPAEAAQAPTGEPPGSDAAATALRAEYPPDGVDVAHARARLAAGNSQREGPR